MSTTIKMTDEELKRYSQRKRNAVAKPSDKQRYLFTIGSVPAGLSEKSFTAPRPDLVKKKMNMWVTGHLDPRAFEEFMSEITMPYGLTETVNSEEAFYITTDIHREDWEEDI